MTPSLRSLKLMEIQIPTNLVNIKEIAFLQ